MAIVKEKEHPAADIITNACAPAANRRVYACKELVRKQA